MADQKMIGGFLDQPPPDYAQQYYEKPTGEYDVPGGGAVASLSIRGSKFSARYQGETGFLRDEQGMLKGYIDVIIVRAHPNVSKAWYDGVWIDGEDRMPDCSSLDGITPDPQSKLLQSERCLGCRWNRRGTAKDAKGNPTNGKACKDHKHVALILKGDPEMERYGGPMLLRIPPTSFDNFRPYAQEIEGAGRNLHQVYTRLTFVAEAAYPMLDFQAVGYAEPDEMRIAKEWRDDDYTYFVLHRQTREIYEDENAIQMGAPAEPAATAATAAPQPATSVATPPPQREAPPAPPPMGVTSMAPPPPAAAQARANRAAPQASSRSAAKPAAAPAAPPPATLAHQPEPTFDLQGALGKLLATDKIMATLDGTVLPNE